MQLMEKFLVIGQICHFSQMAKFLAKNLNAVIEDFLLPEKIQDARPPKVHGRKQTGNIQYFHFISKTI
jgi:hypothetical protein